MIILFRLYKSEQNVAKVFLQISFIMVEKKNIHKLSVIIKLNTLAHIIPNMTHGFISAGSCCSVVVRGRMRLM